MILNMLVGSINQQPIFQKEKRRRSKMKIKDEPNSQNAWECTKNDSFVKTI